MHDVESPAESNKIHESLLPQWGVHPICYPFGYIPYNITPNAFDYTFMKASVIIFGGCVSLFPGLTVTTFFAHTYIILWSATSNNCH